MSSKKKALRFLSIIIVFSLQSFRHVSAQDSMLSNFSYLYMEKLIAVAKENYPRNVVFDKKVNIAKNNVSIAKTSWLDPISFSYMNRSNIFDYDVQGVNSNHLILRGYFFNINFSPSSMFVRKPFDVKNAKEEVIISTSERDEYALKLEAEVKQRYIFYLQHLNALKLTSNRLIDAEATYTNMKTRYERSEIPFKDFNDASIYLTSVQESKISAEANMLTAKFQLEELLTVKLEDIK